MKKDNYLERIAIALETLVAQGNYLSAEVEQAVAPTETVKTPVKAKKEAAPVDKPAVIVQSRALNHADLKAACLKSARADSANRDKLKVLLKGYGAVKAVDVPEGKLAEVIGKIETGEF